MSEGGEGVSSVQEAAVESSSVEPVSTGTGAAPEASSGSSSEADLSNESAHDTVARILREAEAEGGEESKDSEEETRIDTLETLNAESVRPAKQKPQEKGKPKQESFQIPPPNRLTVEQKEVFHQLPDHLKRAAHKMFQDHEAQQTKWTGDVAKAFRESQHVVEAVRPYLLSHPELAAEGFTESKFVSALVAAHQQLTDPKTAKQTWLSLGAQVGVPAEALESLQQHLGSGNGGSSDISQHPQFIALQQQLNKVTSRLDGAASQQTNGEIARKVSEVEALREERDAFGKYKYPKLHDGDFLRTKVKPLVSALEVTLPGLSYGELVRRAHDIVEGNGNSSQVNQARFPGQNEQVERARQAAVSIRGRSAPSASSGSLSDIPPEALEDAESSVRWALNGLRAGKLV